MTELSLTSCCVSTLGSELRITQLYMRKHTQCCSLQTSTAIPYSRGTSPQTVPSSSTKGTRPVWPNFPTNNRAHPHSWQQITDQSHDTEQIKTQLHTDTYMRTYTKVQNKPKQLGKTQGPRNTCHARPGKYYISGVRTVPQTPLWCAARYSKLRRRSHP